MKLRHRKESEISFLESPLRLPVLRTLFIIINESFFVLETCKGYPDRKVTGDSGSRPHGIRDLTSPR